jgi:hypothetical protein
MGPELRAFPPEIRANPEQTDCISGGARAPKADILKFERQFFWQSDHGASGFCEQGLGAR